MRLLFDEVPSLFGHGPCDLLSMMLCNFSRACFGGMDVTVTLRLKAYMFFQFYCICLSVVWGWWFS